MAHLLVDESLWANHPSIIALTEAVSKFNWRIEEVRILSIGTVTGAEYVPMPKTLRAC